MNFLLGCFYNIMLFNNKNIIDEMNLFCIDPRFGCLWIIEIRYNCTSFVLFRNFHMA